MSRVCVAIQLGKELPDRKQTEGKHQSLIPVIPGTPIPLFKGSSHGKLYHLFTVTKDAEFSPAIQNLPPSHNRGNPGTEG
jgi:hypothetical protein